MERNMFKKGLVVGIIGLFFSINVITTGSSLSINNSELSDNGEYYFVVFWTSGVLKDVVEYWNETYNCIVYSGKVDYGILFILSKMYSNIFPLMPVWSMRVYTKNVFDPNLIYINRIKPLANDKIWFRTLLFGFTDIE